MFDNFLRIEKGEREKLKKIYTNLFIIKYSALKLKKQFYNKINLNFFLDYNFNLFLKRKIIKISWKWPMIKIILIDAD